MRYSGRAPQWKACGAGGGYSGDAWLWGPRRLVAVHPTATADMATQLRQPSYARGLRLARWPVCSARQADFGGVQRAASSALIHHRPGVPSQA